MCGEVCASVYMCLQITGGYGRTARVSPRSYVGLTFTWSRLLFPLLRDPGARFSDRSEAFRVAKALDVSPHSGADGLVQGERGGTVP